MLNETTNEQEQTVISFYRTYLSTPPIIGPIFISMANGIPFKPFEVHHSQSDYCQDVAQRIIHNHNKFSPVPGGSSDGCTSISFNSGWWNTVLAAPVVGFLLTALTAWTVANAAKYALRATDQYKDSWAADKISSSIKFTQTKLEAALPRSNTVQDTMKFVALCGATSATYGLVGKACMGEIGNSNDAIDVSTTQAMGGALLPAAAAATGLALCWGFKAAKIVADKCSAEKNDRDVPLLNGQRQRSVSLTI